MWIGLLLAILWTIYSTLYFYGFAGRHDIREGYGVPYRFWRQTAHLVERQATASQADQVWVIVRGSSASEEDAGQVLRYILPSQIRPIFVRQTGSNMALLLPAERPGLYLFLDDMPPIRDAVQQLGGHTIGQVSLSSDAYHADLWLAPARSAKEILAAVALRSDQALDAGLYLIGYTWPPTKATKGELALSSYWTFQDVPPTERSFQHRVRLLLYASDGTPLAQSEGFGLDESDWQEGLVLEQRYRSTLPTGQLPQGILIHVQVERQDGYRHRVRSEGGTIGEEGLTTGPLHLY